MPCTHTQCAFSLSLRCWCVDCDSERREGVCNCEAVETEAETDREAVETELRWGSLDSDDMETDREAVETVALAPLLSELRLRVPSVSPRCSPKARPQLRTVLFSSAAVKARQKRAAVMENGRQTRQR